MVEGFRTIGNLELRAVVYKQKLTLVLYIYDSYRFVICESLFCRVGWKRLSGYNSIINNFLFLSVDFVRPFGASKSYARNSPIHTLLCVASLL